MAHCPSQDWDRYDNDREREAAEEIIFWRENKSDVAAIAGLMLASPAFQKVPGDNIKIIVERAVTLAGMVLKDVVNRGKDPYE